MGAYAGSGRGNNLKKSIVLWLCHAFYDVASLSIVVTLLRVLQSLLTSNKHERAKCPKFNPPKQRAQAHRERVCTLPKPGVVGNITKAVHSVGSFLLAVGLIVGFQITSAQKPKDGQSTHFHLYGRSAYADATSYAPPVATSVPEKAEKSGSFHAVLLNFSFVLIWLAQLVSQIAFNAGNYGLITIVTEVTRSAIMVGIAMICFTLPAIPFSLLAGVYVDHLNKRMVLWVTNILRAGISFLTVVALIFYPTQVIFLFILTFLNSIVTQFFMPAEAASIPMLVGKKNLVQALSLFNITLNIAQAIGFLVLGRVIESFFKTFALNLGLVTVAVRPHDMLFFVITIGYLLCTLLILGIPRRKLRAVEYTRKLPKSPGKEMWAIVERDIKGAWQFVRQDRHLLIAILQVTFVSILLLTIGELAGPFVQQILHLPVDNITMLFAPAGIGLVLGGILMPQLTRFMGTSFTIKLGGILTALGLVLLPLSQAPVATTQIHLLRTQPLIIIGAISFVLGIALDMINIPAQTVMQERSPEDERARILSFEFMLTHAGSIPALLAAGVLADVVGIPLVMYGSAVLIVFCVWLVAHYEQVKPKPHGKHVEQAHRSL